MDVVEPIGHQLVPLELANFSNLFFAISGASLSVAKTTNRFAFEAGFASFTFQDSNCFRFVVNAKFC